MNIYTVGGAVRDSLLGLAVKDRDYVVVGATPKQMTALGFKPVGKDFPVFLHPETHEEYALARTERKTAPGYQGFAFHADPDVTLEQDLARRDLTINAIARASDGSLVDPFGGRADLRARLFRHVSPAFAEDPVRILRLARFAARFTDFKVAPQTEVLMHEMVRAGEVDALVAERVWQELSRGLMEAKPSRMFEVLHACGALARILPTFDAAWGAADADADADTGSAVPQSSIATMIDRAADAGLSLAVRFACLGLSKNPGQSAGGDDDNKLAADLCEGLRVPNECRDLALMSAREQQAAAAILEASDEAVVALLMRCDVFRKPQRFIDMLSVLQCVQKIAADAWPQGDFLQGALRAAQTVKAGEVAALYAQTPERIPEAIYASRVGAIAHFRDVFA